MTLQHGKENIVDHLVRDCSDHLLLGDVNVCTVLVFDFSMFFLLREAAIADVRGCGWTPHLRLFRFEASMRMIIVLIITARLSDFHPLTVDTCANRHTTEGEQISALDPALTQRARSVCCRDDAWLF
jgi:hypothetical protein